MADLPTDTEIARYRADGAICLRKAFSSDWSNACAKLSMPT